MIFYISLKIVVKYWQLVELHALERPVWELINLRASGATQKIMECRGGTSSMRRNVRSRAPLKYRKTYKAEACWNAASA